MLARRTHASAAPRAMKAHARHVPAFHSYGRPPAPRPPFAALLQTSGNDVFYRNPFNVEENLFVNVSSPSSSKYASVADLGSPSEAAARTQQQVRATPGASARTRAWLALPAQRAARAAWQAWAGACWRAAPGCGWGNEQRPVGLS